MHLRHYLIAILLVCTACANIAPAPAPTQQPVGTSPAPTATPDQRSITLTAVGDVMLGRYVGRRIDALGAAYPFSATLELLQADLLVGNLESPLTNRRTPGALRPGPYRLPANPAAVAGLQTSGFSALSLANNHALDAGPVGLQEAAQVVKDAGIAPLGIGANRNEALQPHIITVDGLRVALFSANDVPDPEDQADEGSGWGRAPLDDTFLDTVRATRKEVDTVVVLVHWGTEYAPEPGLQQRNQADALIDAGADVIIGAHPHVLQPIAVVERAGRRALVAYSLGNFVFDQPFSPETSRSAILHLILSRNGVIAYRATPVTIVDGQPRPLTTDDAAYHAVMDDLQLSSSNTIPATPTATASATGGTTSMYTWNGTSFTVAPVAPDQLSVPAAPISATADLRGDGNVSLLTLDVNGIAELHEGPTPDTPVVWHNEDDSWRVTQIVAGDADDDGRFEFLLILWKPDATGALRCHPFLLGWRGGRYRIFWGGSAVSEPIQAAALGDINHDGRTDLAVLEGGPTPGEAATTIAVWRWHGWGFERLWRSDAPGMKTLSLRDSNGDGTLDIIVSRS